MAGTGVYGGLIAKAQQRDSAIAVRKGRKGRKEGKRRKEEMKPVAV
jgi:hypothetical protein